MAQQRKVVVSQYRDWQDDSYSYTVVQVANAVTPHVHEQLTQAQVTDLIESGYEVVVKGGT